jgi:phosphatidylserine/phosphatidylglycerophosphate/cardiolipin synthase-like enzyme
LPPQRLKETIVRAAQRGVKVSILTAGKCDVPLVNLAARHVYETFLKSVRNTYTHTPTQSVETYEDFFLPLISKELAKKIKFSRV